MSTGTSTPRATLPPGIRVLGEYIIERPVERGPRWATYVAWHATRVRERFQVRALRRDAMLQPFRSEAFAREANLLERLQHRGIVPVIAAGVDNGVAAMVMPDVEGRTLPDRLAASQGGLQLPKVARIVREIAAVLDYLHSRELPVVHRALEPAKVLLLTDGSVRVMDVAYAHSLRVSRLDAAEGEGRAPPPYRAPEDQRWASRVGPPVDQFALAAIAFECLVGWPAFPQDAAEAARVIASGVRPSARAARAEVSVATDAVLARAWSVDPAARYATAGEFAEALAEALASGVRAGADDAFVDEPTLVNMGSRVALGQSIGSVADVVKPSSGDVPLVDQSEAADALGAVPDGATIDALFDDLLDNAPTGMMPAPALVPGRPPARREPSPPASPAVGATTDESNPSTATTVVTTAPRAPGGMGNVLPRRPPIPGAASAAPRSAPAESAQGSAGAATRARPPGGGISSLSPRPPPPPSRPTGATGPFQAVAKEAIAPPVAPMPSSVEPPVEGPTGDVTVPNGYGPLPPPRDATARADTPTPADADIADDAAAILAAPCPIDGPTRRVPVPLPPLRRTVPPAAGVVTPKMGTTPAGPPSSPRPSGDAAGPSSSVRSRPPTPVINDLAAPADIAPTEAPGPLAAPAAKAASPAVADALPSGVNASRTDAPMVSATPAETPAGAAAAPLTPEHVPRVQERRATDTGEHAVAGVTRTIQLDAAPPGAPARSSGDFPAAGSADASTAAAIDPYSVPTVDTIVIGDITASSAGRGAVAYGAPPGREPSAREITTEPPPPKDTGAASRRAAIIGLSVVGCAFIAAAVLYATNPEVRALVAPRVPATAATRPARLNVRPPAPSPPAPVPAPSSPPAVVPAVAAPAVPPIAAPPARPLPPHAPSPPVAAAHAPVASPPAPSAPVAVVPPPTPPAPAIAAPSGPLPVYPAMRYQIEVEHEIARRIAQCEGHYGRHARVEVTYDGPTGQARTVEIAGNVFSRPPIGPCIDAAVRAVPYPPFARSTWVHGYILEVR